jgi:hypothetical protein
MNVFVFVPRSRHIGMVRLGLIPAPATYKSLEFKFKSPLKRRKEITNSFPMLIGKPFAPRSPRPRILEPSHGSSLSSQYNKYVRSTYRLLRLRFAILDHLAKMTISLVCVLYVRWTRKDLRGDAIYEST